MRGHAFERSIVVNNKELGVPVRLAIVLITFLIALCPRPALTGEAEIKALARAHYETATRLYAVGEYERALVEFKAAYVTKADPAFLFNIGQCHLKAGRIDEAVASYRSFLSHAAPNDPSRPQVEAILRRTQDDVVFREDLEPAPSAAPAPAWDNPFDADATLAPVPVVAISIVPKSMPLADRKLVLTERTSLHHRDTGRGLRVAGIVASAVGVASIGAAIYFYTRARHYSDVVSADRNHTVEDVQEGRIAEDMQWLFYSVGAAALAAGAVFSWYGWTARPVAGPGIAGISAGGAF